MTTINFHKVQVLPETPEPNALYFVRDENSARLFVTDAGGVPIPVHSAEKSLNKIEDGDLGLRSVLSASSLEELNTLKPHLPDNTLVMLHFRENDSMQHRVQFVAYDKQSQTFLDVSSPSSTAHLAPQITQIEWDNIQNRPQAYPQNIDDTVKGHRTLVEAHNALVARVNKTVENMKTSESVLGWERVDW